MGIMFGIFFLLLLGRFHEQDACQWRSRSVLIFYYPVFMDILREHESVSEQEHLKKLTKIGQPAHQSVFSLHLPIPETAHQMVVHHSAGLHMGIDDRRANELEAAFFKVGAKGI